MIRNKNNLDYLNILYALKSIPFSIGEILLIDFLKGKTKNSKIQKFKLDKNIYFSSLDHLSNIEIKKLLNKLKFSDLINVNYLNGKKFQKILAISERGEKEIKNPSLNLKEIKNPYEFNQTNISENDKKIFNAFGTILSKYNDEQKKAICSKTENILCIAGAGSGKTSVLTKRIEFLIKYNSIESKNILAITFTKKAKEEMINRLNELNIFDVKVETFNSFCEKILLKNNDIIYAKKPFKVLNYQDKILIVKLALLNQKLNFFEAIKIYFKNNHNSEKTLDELIGLFINDCFFIRDYFKFKNKDLISELFTDINQNYKEIGKLVFNICIFIDKYMEIKGFRDYSDQILDTLKFFNISPNLIPKYEHILIDEYQDINSSQIKLIDFIYSKNLFVVGDPRQSIYAWRGSDIKYILNFPNKYANCEIINLKKNYRSRKKIIKFFNIAIKNQNFPPLESTSDENGELEILKFENEDLEFNFIAKNILESKIPRNEIFVLSRTNRQLEKISKVFLKHSIKFKIKNENSNDNKENNLKENEIILSTIHAIKGLEAEKVFLISADFINFPCRSSEHPIINMIKIDEYDIEEEELRIFYVAISRAKKSLILTHSGKNLTYYINEEMIKISQEDKFHELEINENKKEKEFLKINKEDNNFIDENIFKDYFEIKKNIFELNKKEEMLKNKIKLFMEEKNLSNLNTENINFSIKKQLRTFYPKEKIEKEISKDILDKIRVSQEISVFLAKIKENN